MTSPPLGVDAVHERLAGDLLAVGAPYGLVLAGGEAVRAHGLVDGRVSEGVDLATEHPAGMAEIAGAVRAGLEERGWPVEAPTVDPLAARLVVGDEASGGRWRVDLRKEVLWRPPVTTGAGPALSLEDLVGTRVRALADRGCRVIWWTCTRPRTGGVRPSWRSWGVGTRPTPSTWPSCSPG